MKKGKKQGLENSPPGSKLSRNAAGVASVGNLEHRNTGNRFQPGNPHRFKPGQSGNPGGKPCMQRAVTLAVVKEQLGAVHPKLGTTALERIVAHTIRRALQGSYKDKKLLLNYALGMPTQLLEASVGLDLSNTIREARERTEARERAEAAAEALLPAPTSGTSDAQTARAATDAAEQDSARDGDAAQPAKPKIMVEPWAN